jgi:hypothetical protein
VTGREVVLKPADWEPIRDYLSMRKVPGFADGGATSPTTASGGSQVTVSAGAGAPPVNLRLGFQIILGKEDMTQIGLAFATSEDGRAVSVAAIEEDINKNGMDGLLGSVVLQLLRRKLING